MAKIWLNSYPSDVPAEVDVNEFGSLKAMLESVCSRYPTLTAFSNQGAHITYRELEELSRHFAAYLQKKVGLLKGDRVAIMMPNLLQYPVALFGVLRAGCTVVNTNPLYTARELHYQLADSGATCIIVLENFAHTLQEALPDTEVRKVIVTGVGDLFHFPKAQITNFVVRHVKHMVPEWHIDGAVLLSDALDAGANLSLDDVPLNADDVAFLQYTGGTTGVPKGAVLTHANIVANTLQCEAWIKGVMKEGKETAIIPLPLYHVLALTATLTFLKLGANSVLITNPRDLDAFVNELKHTKFTAMIGVNTLFNALLNAPGIAQVDASGLKMAIAGGMAVQRSVAEKWQQVFHIAITEGYGLTETSPLVCANPLRLGEYTGMIGLPVSSTEVAILDDEGHALGLGEFGEICIRGPQVMKGYWHKPEETANVFTADGWLRSGDMGIMDQRGYVKLLDRKKDVIVVSGFKVFPNEVEDVTAMHHGVLEVAAIAAPDERSEHVVKIVVVRKDPALTAEELIEHCRQYLAAYKVPKYVVFREQPLPKSNIGKILRRVVKDEENDEDAIGTIIPGRPQQAPRPTA